MRSLIDIENDLIALRAKRAALKIEHGILSREKFEVSNHVNSDRQGVILNHFAEGYGYTLIGDIVGLSGTRIRSIISQWSRKTYRKHKEGTYNNMDIKGLRETVIDLLERESK